MVRNKIPLIFDSGLRFVAYITKALALGATMTGIGRPYTYALALDGARGVETLIQHLAAELELNMALSGTKSVLELEGILQNPGLH